MEPIGGLVMVSGVAVGVALGRLVLGAVVTLLQPR